ncbi:MAG: type II toxin-antitoxin system HigB family toxin [Thermoflexales bacterium]|nr:type II toxin-antitoxin system HigB family toxin [Thermoflexales bacterium]
MREFNSVVVRFGSRSGKPQPGETARTCEFGGLSFISVCDRNFGELRATFPTADKVSDWIVFNIGGSKYRLIASIHFNRGAVYVRQVLTHQVYDKRAWKK